MPKFESYPLVSEVESADKFLIHQDSSGAEKTILAANVAASFTGFVQAPFSVINLAALRALDITNVVQGTLALVAGHTNLLDGGGGGFYYNPNASDIDNNGTIIAPNLGSGRWFRSESKIINIKWFGAYGDNLHDDLTPIQSAINLAKTFATSTVYIPPGEYRLSASINVLPSPASNISFVGDGPNVSILRRENAGNGLVATFTDNGTFQDNRITITGLGFQTTANGGTAITITYGNPAVTQNHLNQSVLIDNVSIKSDGVSGNWGNGIDITSAWACQISNTFISGNSQGSVWANLAGNGITLHRSCVNSIFSNIQCAFFEHAFEYSADGTGANDPNTEGLTFTNCIFTACKTGLLIAGNPNYVIGVTPVPRVSGVVWSGGIMDLRSSPSGGVDFTNVEDFFIANTMIIEGVSAIYGMTLENCGGGTVKGVEMFAFGLGINVIGTSTAITIKDCAFNSGSAQVSFGPNVTQCRSGGHVIRNTVRHEENVGNGTNRIFFGDGMTCIAHLTSPETTLTGVEETLDWDAVFTEDMAPMWDIADPSKLVVPYGASRVRITANVRWDTNATGSRQVKIKSSNPAGGIYPTNAVWASVEHDAGNLAAGGSSGDSSLTTPIIDVKADPDSTKWITDFTLAVRQDSGGDLLVLGSGNFLTGTTFAMEILG